MQKSKINFLIFLFFLFTIHYSRFTNLYAEEAALTWDPNTEEDLAGYKVYWGIETRNYTEIEDVGLTDTKDTPTYTVNYLTEGYVYFFSVTAYDKSGNESEYSEEVSKAIETPDDGGSQDSSKTEDTNNGSSSNVGNNTPQSPGEDSSSATSTVTSAQTGSSGCGIAISRDSKTPTALIILLIMLGLMSVRRRDIYEKSIIKNKIFIARI